MSFIFIYGPPGSGKTTLACSMTNLGYKVEIDDLDQKANKMKNIEHLIQSNKVTVNPIVAKLSEASLREQVLNPKLALAKQPQGFLMYADKINEREKEMQSGVTKMDTVLVTDSLTRINEHLKRLISNIQRSEKLGYDGWAAMLSTMESLLYNLMALQGMYKHVIVIAHDAMEKDEDSGRILRILPAIDGSMKNKISSYFEEVYHTKVEMKGGVAKYVVATKAVDKAEARTSRDIDTYVESDFSIIFKGEVADG